MVKPVFSAVAAVSLDGRITVPGVRGSAWTSREDKEFLHDFLDKSDVVLVGSTTYRAAIKPLSKRNCIVLTSKVKTILRKDRLTLFCNPKSLNPRSLVKRLGYRQVAVLGGQKVYSYCLKKGLLDELYLTVEPVIFGQGLSIFEGEGLFTRDLKLISLWRLNARGSVLARYRLSR